MSFQTTFPSRKHTRRKFLQILVFGCLFLSGISFGQVAPEYRVKAVFLFNFAQFVTWPDSAFTDSKAPFVIGIIGKDPFGQTLDDTVRGESVGGRSIEVRRYSNLGDVKNCHILFVANSEATRVRTILRAVESKPILTVGEFEGFAAEGGMIRFLSDKNKIRFRINADAASAEGLAISSKLLRLAEIVKTERSTR